MLAVSVDEKNNGRMPVRVAEIRRYFPVSRDPLFYQVRVFFQRPALCCAEKTASWTVYGLLLVIKNLDVFGRAALFRGRWYGIRNPGGSDV